MKDVIATDSQQFGTIWAQCVVRAWQDAQFREALKRDPTGTLLASYEFALPAGVHLQVVERHEATPVQQADTLQMVIPPAPDMNMREVALATHEADPSTAPFSCAC
ncbi:hypothetical protein [Hyalangium rubrum]|uniref:NHLP leader peptide family natural product n=1 Tax=Hyalangium rubrum TaxID=3103134 RepID=A0ABU5H6H7_9BACT|nr:hypothetical protein [Hyalangium sp. s54d21]MDY7228945.1 hypothetical protein [Hyalangium sp. s54d21]